MIVFKCLQSRLLSSFLSDFGETSGLRARHLDVLKGNGLCDGRSTQVFFERSAHEAVEFFGQGLASLVRGMPTASSNQALVQTEKYVSQSGLASVLRSIKEHGLPEASSRSGIKRARDRAMPAVWTSISLERNDGSSFEVPIIHPILYLQHLLEIDAFALFVLDKLKEHPCAQDNPWTLALYCDEIVPGNPLKPQGNARKVIAFYWSFCEFDDGLGDDSLWFHLGSIRSAMIKDQRPRRSDRDVKAGWSQFFRKAALKFFEFPRNLKEGLFFNIAGEICALWADIGSVIADEAALKQVWGFKGASGAMPCFLCRNCTLHSLQLHVSDSSGWLVSHTEPSLERFLPQTDQTLLEAAEFLATKHAEPVSKAQFARFEYSLGLNFNPEGALWSRDLLACLRGGPVSCSLFDWMHVYLVNGAFHSEVTACMEAAKGVLSFHEAHAYLQPWTFPKALSSRGVTGRALFKKIDETVKSSASEGLTIYPVLRSMVLERIPENRSPALDLARRSFLALCQVLDVLRQCFRKEQPSGGQLAEAIQAHTLCRAAAYGTDEFQPKVHYALHLPEFLTRGRLLQCWVHERKHKDLKKWATDLANASLATTAFERSILQSSILAQDTALNALDRCVGFSLESTQNVPPKVLAALGAYLGMHVLLARMGFALRGPTMKVSKGDVVLGDNSGKIGEVWFFVEIEQPKARRYLCWSLWSRLGDNHYARGDEPSFLPVEKIDRALIWRQNADGSAHVAP